MEDSPLPKKRSLQWLCATTAASCFVCLTQMLGRDQWTTALHWSVGLFAFAIPVLAVFSFRSANPRHKPPRATDLLREFLRLAGLLAGGAGLATTFAHFGCVYVVVFLVSVAVALSLTIGKEPPKDL
jgi:hypothetical protein